MGRKKKSGNKQSGAETKELSRGSQDNGGENLLCSVDWLELQLSNSLKAGSSSTRNSTKPPILHVNESDAKKLNVGNGDDVIFLLRSTNGSIAATAVCGVAVAPNGSSPRRLSTSPQSRMTSGSITKSMRLPAGQCQISPILFANQLLQVALETKVLSAPIETSSIPQPSPSKPSSGFSFAKGGGGDLLISPKSQDTPKFPSSPASNLSKAADCVVVPVDSEVGDQLSRMVCDEAAQLHLQISSDAISESIWKVSRYMLSRLVLATNEGRYIHVGDTIGTSFQGKIIELSVMSVVGISAKGASSLEERLNSLSLDAATRMHSATLMDDVRLALRRDLERTALFRLSTSTQVSTHLDGSAAPSEDSTSVNPTKVVAGLDTTIEQVKRLLLPPLLHPELFSKGSLKPPRGVLLFGTSGVGKTLLAKQIALDLELETRVEYIQCTSLQSHTAVVGKAERKLTQLFHTLQKQSTKPSGALLILDDIHLICPKRDGRNPGVDRLAATLLALLDGIGPMADASRCDGKLVILAMTTDPSALDPALRRPGRLDREVEVAIPDELTRAQIMRFQLESFRPAVDLVSLSDEDVLALSRLAKGFNGADCMLAIKEAARSSATASLASPEAKPQVSLHDLQLAIRSTKPSTISAITVEIPQVRWSSIGGMESVKQKLREAIELPITHAHLFEKLNIPPPRGVLLYGPPGCSKTLMARALATEGQMNFLAVKGPELLSKWLGESERALASLFRRARMASPCIVFFDEIDAIAARRGSGDGSAGGERLLSQLLTELDGVRSTAGKLGSSDMKERIVVVGATNRPDLLDSALIRPGRIDRKIYVGLPDESSRARIFEIGLSNKACSDDVSITELAKDEVSSGFSGAELIGICREAALFAIEEQDDDERTSDEDHSSASPRIGARHLLQAIGRMQRQVTPAMLDFYASYNNGTKIEVIG